MPVNDLNQPIGVPVPNWQGSQKPERNTLTGRYCRLTPLDAARHGVDLAKAYAQDEEGALWTYLFFGQDVVEQDFDDLIQQLSQTEDPHYYAVEMPEGQAVGIASYMRINPKAGSIEVGGIAFSPALQRTRAATEAMYLMMRYAFETLGYRRYEWKCDDLNAPSRKAAERLGFTYEGTFRQALVYKERNRDTAWYSILDSEWPRLKRGLEAWLSPDNFDASGLQRQRLSDLLAPLS